MEGTKVRLLVDLTRYHPAFVCGAEGVCIQEYGVINDRFFRMEIPGKGHIPVLWQSVEIIQ